MPSQTPSGDPRPYRILSLSGGGFLGLYTAVVLEGLEAAAARPLARCFDLVAGTSIGGVLALALAFEVPAARMVELFRRHGPRIFSQRPLPTGPVGRVVDLSRSVLGPKYAPAALRSALTAEFGARTLGDATHAVVVPAVEIERCRTKVFKTPHSPASRGDEDVPVVDVALAACAAPAYFPGVRIGGRLYADGGLFAVAPDLLALHEAQHFVGVARDRVRLLSIGTAASGYRPRAGPREDAGAVGWLAEGRLLLTVISVQQQHVQAMAEDLLGPRYLRLDAPWPADGGLGIDVASPAAVQRLSALAQATLRDTPPQALAPFLHG